MSFHKYLKNKYTIACEIQDEIQNDKVMIAMLRDGQQDADIVRSWMLSYRLFQGITAQDRNIIVEKFLEFAQTHTRPTQQLTEVEIEALYSQLLTDFYQSVPRSWVSASSKLLWCLYPETVVIYDAFVHRTLVVMQCIDDDLAGFPRISGAPRISRETDIATAVQHYMNYQSMVRRLLTVYSSLLIELRNTHNTKYPYDIRILDKVLWMIGNSKQAY